MAPIKDYRNALAPLCHEIDELPPDWQVRVTDDELKRCYFVCPETNKTSYENPARGDLPRPWILRVMVDPKVATPKICYYHRETYEITTKDPRPKEVVPSHLRMAASLTKWSSSGHDLDKLQRQPIGNDISLRDQYRKVKTIDKGANKEGGVGGMNDGVFIVRMTGVPDRYFVEKRFLCDERMMKYAKKEIEMLRRGSLQDLIKAYKKHQANLPEGFIWHAFLGLFDGLAYLQGGGRFMTAHPNPPNPNWKPILHRDIKPDNVLMRARTTYGSQKPPYCVLGDFGLACEEGTSELSKSKCGTSAWWAPELLYTPYPAGDPDTGPEWDNFKVNQGRHADVWALGTVIYGMAKSNEYAHINWAKKPAHLDAGDFYQGTESRRLEPFTIDLTLYTKQLQDGILSSTEYFMRNRPDAVKLIPELKKKFDEAVQVRPNMIELAKLADWAAPAHKYRADESEIRTGVKKSNFKASGGNA